MNQKRGLNITIVAGIVALVVTLTGSVGNYAPVNAEDSSTTTTVTNEDSDRAVDSDFSNDSLTEAQKKARERLQKFEENAKDRLEALSEKAQKRAELIREQTDKRIADLQAKQEEIRTRLTAKRLELCQKREAKLDEVIARIDTRGVDQLELFDTIAERAKAFYETKDYSVSNYDELLAAINVARAKAETAVVNVKANVETFSCDSDDPKGTLNSVGETLRNRIAALKEYRTAVKNLIVAIKQAAESEE